ncbi:MAG: FMN-binding negative transcriptional regulator [Chloroflexi bacterium]|uniref:FMN-binding negative transcriptional regulator n=1 Tax=Candidatus Chlorohelix allophototropha TaxID=3003348 RepID=A0A8T7M170_9CHLR|nr:FMN-binding negative transcriptional regulator [Chloroflexota bacterium]WJW67599.1 FMN-binding negative transcriptional regulator [Chloroflexota bacterium L227-S17]
MYIPKSFEENDLPELHAMMRRFNFATLITALNGAIQATHIPFMLDETRGKYGTLQAHIARANQQWQDFSEGVEALVIFQGPHAYISPSWYEVHPSVPTWNYVAIHAYGIPRLLEGYDNVHPMLGTLVQNHEQHYPHPWTMDLPEDYMQNMVKGIVGIEIEITRLEGKYKMSQNRGESDRSGVIRALEGSTDPLVAEVSDIMKRVEK